MRVRHIDTGELKRLLDERWMTRNELAERTGLSKSFVNYLANGQRNPRKATVELIAQALDVPVDQFVTEEWAPRTRTSASA